MTSLRLHEVTQPMMCLALRIAQDVLAAGRVAVDIALRVALDRDELDRALAIGVDGGDRRDGAGAAGFRDQPVVAGAGIEDADLDTPSQTKPPK